MRIRALTSFAGPKGCLDEAEEREVSEETGRSWVKAGLAEKVKPEAKTKKGQKDDLFEDERIDG